MFRALNNRVARQVSRLVLPLFGAIVALTVMAAPASAAIVTVSGTAQATDAAGIWVGCDNVTPNIAVSVNGAAPATVPCATANGAWTTPITLAAAGDKVTVWLDTNGGAQGSIHTVSVDAVSNITGLKVAPGTALLRTEDASAMTNAVIGVSDSAIDGDIPLTVAAGNLTAAAGTKLLVPTGESFTPGGNVTTPAADIRGTFTGGGNTITFTGGGTATTCAGSAAGTMMPLCVAGGTLSLATATVQFTTTTNAAVAPATTYGTLLLAPSAAGTPTYTLGAADTSSVTVSGNLTVGDGTNGVVVTTARTTSCTTVGGNLWVQTGATLTGGSSCPTIINAQLTVDGTMTMNAGTIELRATGGGGTAIAKTTAGTLTLNDLILSNATGGAINALPTANAGSSIVVSGVLQVGRSTDGFGTTFQEGTNNAILDIDGDLNITTKGTFTASNTQQLTIGGNFTNNGTFTAGTGTVEFDDASRTSTLQYGAATTFYNLLVQTASKSIRFDTAFQTNVTGTTGGNPGLTINGGACGTLIGLSSKTAGTRAPINATGTVSIDFADIGDINTIAALTATNSFDAGNNLNWTAITGACATITVAGTAYNTETGTVWTGCNGVALRIGISVAGRPQRTVACNAGTGAYTATVVGGTDLTTAVYFNAALTADRAVTYTRTVNAGTNLTGIDLHKGGIEIRSETATNTTNAHMAQWDSTESSSVPATFTWASNYLQTSATWNGSLSNLEFKVLSGESWAPGGDVTSTAIDVRGTLSTPGAQTLTITGNGFNDSCDSALATALPFCVDSAGGGAYSEGCSSTTRYTYTGGAQAFLDTISYHRLEIQPTGGTPTFQVGTAAAQSLTASEIIIGGTGGNPTFWTSNAYTPSVTASSSCSTSEGNIAVAAGAVVGGTGNLFVHGDFTGAGTVTRTAFAGTYMRPARDSVTLGPSGSNNWTFYTLQAYNLATTGGPTRTVSTATPAGASLQTDYLYSGQAGYAPTILNLDAGDAPVTSQWDVIIQSTGQLEASSSATLTVGRNFSMAAGGTFNGNGGTVSFTNNSFDSIVTGGPTFSNLSTATANKRLTLSTSATTTVTGTLTTSGSACGTAVRIRSTIPGTAASLNAASGSLQYTEFVDVNSTNPLSATDSFDGGNNTNLTVTNNSCTPVTVSGTAYENQVGTFWSGCDGATRNIAIRYTAFGFVESRHAACSPVNGTWTATYAPFTSADTVVMAFLNTNGGDKGATWTRNLNQTASIPTFDITRNRVRLRSESATPMSVATMNLYDGSYDTDIPYDNAIATGEVVVDAGHVFTPGAQLTMPSLDVRGTINFGAQSMVTNRGGTNTDCNQDAGTQTPLCVTGTFNADTGQMYFTEPNTESAYIPTNVTYHSLTFSNIANAVTTFHLGTGAGQTVTADSINLVHSGSTLTSVRGDTFATTIVAGSINSPTYTQLYAPTSTSTLSAGMSVGFWGQVTLGATTVQASAANIDLSVGTGGGLTIANDLHLRTSGATPRTVSFGSGNLSVMGTLEVGNVADTAATTFAPGKPVSAAVYAYNVNVTTQGVFLGSPLDDAVFEITNDLTVNGTFTPQKHRIEFTNTAASTIASANPISFYSLRVVGAGKRLNFPTNVQTNVTGTTGTYPGLTTLGTGCTTPALVRLNSTAGAWNLDVTGSSNVQYASIGNSTAITGVSATQSYSLGGNTNWTITGCPTVSGNVYSDESGTVPAICNGVTPVVAVVLGGAAGTKATTPCAAGTGAFAVDLNITGAGQIVTAWIDGVALTRGAQYVTTAGSGNLSGLQLIYDHVLMRSDNAAVLTAATINTWDNSNDSDLPIAADGSANLTDASTTELKVLAGTTFTETGSITLGALDVRGTYLAGFTYTTGTMTLTTSGTGACSGGVNVQMPLCTAGGTQFSNASRDTIFTGNGNTSIPDDAALGRLIIQPTVGGYQYDLCQAGSDTTTSVGGGTIGNGTAAVTVDVYDCETWSIDQTTSPLADSTMTVGAGSTIGDGGPGIARALTLRGSIVGAGDVNLGDTNFSVIPFYANASIAPESQNWAIGNMDLWSSNSRSLTLGAGAGTGSLTTGTITESAGTNAAILTNGNHALIVNGSLSHTQNTFQLNGTGAVTVNGTLSNSSTFNVQAASLTVTGDVLNTAGTLSMTSGYLTIGDDFQVDGTFTKGTGTVEFNTAADAWITGTAAPSFYNLRVATPSKKVFFQESRTYDVTGSTGTYPGLTVNGAACGTQAQLLSLQAGQPSTFNVTGSSNVQYAKITDMIAFLGLTANSSSRSGTTTGWTVNNCTVAVSGFARAGENTTSKWASCNGVTQNISASSAGKTPAKVSAVCNNIDGSFTINIPVNIGGDVFVIYMDSGGGTKGAIYSTNPDNTSPIGGIELMANHVNMQSISLTNALVNVYDGDQDADLPITVDGSNNASTSSTIETYISAGASYDPGGALSVGSLDIRGAYKTNAIDTFMTTITAGGTINDCDLASGVGAPLCITAAGTQSLWDFTFTSSSSLWIDGNSDTRFGNLNLSPPSGSPSYRLGANGGESFGTYGNVTVGTGAAAMTFNVELPLRVGTRCPSGAGSCGTAGNITVNANATMGGTGTVEAYGNVSGAGTMNFTGGTFYRRDFTGVGGSSAGFGSTSGANQWTFNNLTFDTCETSASPLLASAGGTGLIKVSGNLTVTGGASFDATTNERNYDVDGGVIIAAASTLTAPDTGTFTVGGNFTNSGTFVPGTGQVTFDTLATNL